MQIYAQIAVNVPSVAGVFDYAISEDLAGEVGVGQLVIVPFGRQRVQGVILRFVDRPSVAETKDVLEILDSDPVLTSTQIALAEWMAEATLSPLAAIVSLMVPTGLGQKSDILYGIRELEIGNRALEANHDFQLPITDLSQTQSRILKLLTERGPLRGRQLDTHFRHVDWRKSAEWLVRRGILKKKSVLPEPRVRPKQIRVAQLAVSLEEAEAALSDLGKTEATQTRRSAALRYLMQELDEVNVSWIYAESGCNSADLQILAERGLIVLRENETWRDPLEAIEKRVESRRTEISIPKLTSEQKQAWGEIYTAFVDSISTPFLLHGVTGSGKTELYIRAAEEVVRRGKQAIILVPEIALTPQTVRRFLARFPGQVGLIHSKLSEGERYDTWRRARAGLLKVVIGPRSALFAPLSDIGFIAIDECHDGSYYQSEPPFYHAVEAAKAYARLAGAVLIMGSATPSIVQRREADTGESTLLELPNRIASAQESKPHQTLDLPPVSVIDMREELKAGNRGIFSHDLLDALSNTLERGEQAILFLNRRGTATYVFCRDCGYALKCPQCDTPLTFHVENKERLVCHHCSYTRQKPRKCPQCGSAYIREYGLGSERVETEVGNLFPGTRVLRWDWETTRQKDAHEIILSHFANHRADVLVGTQMLAKGLDLPLVTLVGVILADVGLNLPDPFSSERVFQVLTQVAGRAGRSIRGGRVVLQTFQPEHPVVQAASGHDYAGFYEQELLARKKLGYPPFGRLVRMEYRHRDNERAEAEANKTAGKLKSRIEAGGHVQTTLIGPVPCFFSKLRGEYRWQIILRGPNPAEILQSQRFDGWRVEVDPTSLL